MSEAKAWYALHVRSNHEKSVHAQLEAKRHNSFLPLSSEPRKWADRWKTVSMPLFPGYVFCEFHMAQRSSVLATSGVIDLVRTGSQPAAIEPAEVEAIQRIVTARLNTEPFRGFANGNRVMMSDGPLKGMAGTLIEIRREFRFVISVELLCRSVLVEIDRDWVIPCQDRVSSWTSNLS